MAFFLPLEDRKHYAGIPPFPEIDIQATGERIRSLRLENGYSIEYLTGYLRLSGPRSIYYWQEGKSLPSVDSLYALSQLFDIPMNEILVEKAA